MDYRFSLEKFFRDTILGITTTAASIQLGNFCTSTIKGVSNRKEGAVFFPCFLKNLEDDADAGETQGWRTSLEGFW